MQLLEDGGAAVRPTQAVPLGNGIYRILPTPDYDPEDEIWEFLPGPLYVVKLIRITGLKRYFSRWKELGKAVSAFLGVRVKPWLALSRGRGSGFGPAAPALARRMRGIILQ